MNERSQVPLVASVRAYVETKELKVSGSRKFREDIGASKWSLIFDTETTVDARQELRFAFYQLREGDRIFMAGAVYNPDELSQKELGTLKQFAKEKGLELETVREFLDNKFLGLAYELCAAYIGFNLPFDLSRLAINHAAAKPSNGNYSMVGGFSFRYSEDSNKPKIQVKHLSSRNALIRFTLPRSGQQTPGGMRRREIYSADRRGHFIDLRSLGAALLSGSWSLKTLSNFLQTEHRKLETEEHGGRLTKEYLEYAYQDVQVTWECYVELAKRYQALGLSTRPEKIISEASLGKAYIDEMRIRPWTKMQPDFPRRILGAVMASYYGGRAEVHARRISVPVVYCDFLSMYPTVCVLMKMWRFVIATGVKHRDITEWTTKFLDSVALEDLQDPETWQKLTVLVRVQPDGDVLPVRAKYDSFNRSIGLNHLTSSKPMWFTLADCIVSKLLTGKSPTVLEAIAFRPAEVQEDLEEVNIAGNPNYRVNSLRDDFFKKVIELRSQVKGRLKVSEGQERDRLHSEQQSLKICANATSYGIYVELNPNSHGRPVEQVCYGCSDDPFDVSNASVEEPGKFFHPILGTLITGAARLMLALSERVGMDRGLTWAFCDTDGIAFTPAPNSDVSHEELIESVSTVQDWFKPLSPYEGKPEILKVEDENFATDGKTHEPLFCFAVSAKRYALFNLGTDGSIVLRKATAHGLGHLSEPYADHEGPKELPIPTFDYAKQGLKRWHCDLWHQVISSGLSERPEIVNLEMLPGLSKSAVSKYSATTPELLDWFAHYNTGKPYSSQVRPFGFMLSFQPRKELGSREMPKASAPFNRDLVKASLECFDRETGEMIPVNQLGTIREALWQFHLHPESKFHGGNYTDRGFTERKHVRALAVEHIGKEANRWEESVELGEALAEEVTYGESPQDEASRLATVIELCRKCNRRKLAELSGVCLREVTRVLTGKVGPTKATLDLLEVAANDILSDRDQPKN